MRFISLFHSFIAYYLIKFIVFTNAKVIDICDQTNGIDLSTLDLTVWNLTHIQTDKTRLQFMINICTPFKNLTQEYNQCNDNRICVYTNQRPGGDFFRGYEPTSVISRDSKVESSEVVYTGPECDFNLKYTLRIIFTCGPHLEYPQLLVDHKCQTTLIWRTLAVCKDKSLQKEAKCYVYDNEGLRRDLTPLIKTKGDYYRVLSADQEFYINVCSDAAQVCPSNSSACFRNSAKELIPVGDYRFNTLEFKSKTATVKSEHIELTYRAKNRRCNNGGTNNTAKTTIRFICPQTHEKRSIEFEDRIPKLVSNLDCDYEIEWLTEYACPTQHIQTEANRCELIEDIHGINFNLKTMFKRKTNAYKIENITIDNSKTLYDIHFNVCGGLGDNVCGDKQWKSNTVCLKSRDQSVAKDKVIGLMSEGTLTLADNKLLLRYTTKESDCKFGNNSIAESTVIEFVCDDSKDFDFIGSPEFIAYDECNYFIEWKTSLVCPVISPKTTCTVTHNDLTFDLSLLRRGFGSEPWIASVSQNLPWSRHAKDEKDVIYLNVCGLLPKTDKTNSCDGRSSACLTVEGTNTSVNLGTFRTPPHFNEDSKTIELVYKNGFDSRTNKNITSKFTFHCKPGSLQVSPTLVDVDMNEESGTYEFEWETSAACPKNAFVGTDDCKVYNKFLDYTFDLSPLKSISSIPIKVDKYEYHISVCGVVNNSVCNSTTITNATGPYGACQVEIDGDKRAFSLGKANSRLTYWNGVINMTLIDGSPYRNPEKTPRKSHIAFICDPTIELGTPEYDGERNRSYFFRWYTQLACPHVSKTVHCVWDNGSHILDLTPLAMTNGNHFTVGVPSSGEVPSIYYINICRPLNPIHDIPMTLKSCGRNSAACKVTLGDNPSVLSLGEPTQTPISGFDGSVNLFYENGSICPTNKDKRIRTRIKFVCDPSADLSNPTVYEPGSEQIDGEECIYFFEWRTSAVCDVIQPTKLEDNSCSFTDRRTGLSVDLSPLKKAPNAEPYKVLLNQNNSTFELNVCGTARSFASSICDKSAVCFRGGNSVVSYGSHTSSSFFFNGNDLRLRYFNGSKCSAHSDSGRMSTEIIFRCNPEAKQSLPKLYSYHSCIVVFEWETDLVCNLELPKCSIIGNNEFYNLRQLSSISHAWNTTDKNGNTYFLNVCTKLPQNIECKGVNSASCKCKYDSNNTSKLNCMTSLGDPSADELSYLSKGKLLLTYKNGGEEECSGGLKAQTQITFNCGKHTGNPKFTEFVPQKCIYKFDWMTYIACPVNERIESDQLLAVNNGFLHDSRINTYINITSILDKTFYVKEMRKLTNSHENYTYVINLSKSQSTDSKCSSAAVCQMKDDSDFKRDIGSIDWIQYYLKGRELQIVLQSFSTTLCGKNRNKNVTTIIRLQCSSYSGVGEPTFIYESNDCDYTFNWNTEAVCPNKFLNNIDSILITTEPPKDQSSANGVNNVKSSHSNIWIGIFIVLCLAVTLTFLIFYKQRFRQSVMFRFRRLFSPETDHTFHYHQLASYEKDRQQEVVFINTNDSINRTAIAAQPSSHVPYYSIYDDSDVDLLT